METLQQQLKSQSPKYLYWIIHTHNTSHRTRQCNKIPAINVKHDFFKNLFFFSDNWVEEIRLEDWKLLIRITRILPFIRSSPNSTFNCHKPRRIKLLSQLKLGLSRFSEHKFIHSFQGFLKYFCSCGKSETSCQFSSTVPTIQKNDWPSWTQ